MLKKIAFFDTKPYDIEIFNSNNNNKFSIKYFNTKLNVHTAPLSKGFATICAFVNDEIDKQVIDILFENKVKLIALRCAGYNNVDLKYIYKKINVVRVPAYSPYAVAEHALALIMALNRKIHKAYSRTRDNNFDINGLMGFDMNGKTVGIIGAGKIGQVLCKILKGLSCNVIVYDKYIDKNLAKNLGVELVDMDTIFVKSDIISLHCPLNKETFHLINEDTILKMKKGVMIINTSRGKLIDTKALIDGLKDEKIAYAGLDVYEEENEYFFEDFSNSFVSDDVLSRLLTFNNVIVTSHQGFFTLEALNNIATTTFKNINDFISGSPLDNEICYKCNASVCIKQKKGRCF